MRRVPLLASLIAGASILLVACAAPSAEPPAASSSAPAPATSPSPTASPSTSSSALITLDGFADPEGGTGVPFDRADEVVTYVGKLAGEAPVVTDIEDPWGNGTSMGTRYEWNGIGVSVFGEYANVWVSQPVVGATRLTTAEGVGVGSTRAEATAAGAWEVYDDDGDGAADVLGIGSREVAGTTSLSRPGQDGIEYVLLRVEDDVVTQIQAPADDFSDI